METKRTPNASPTRAAADSSSAGAAGNPRFSPTPPPPAAAAAPAAPPRPLTGADGTVRAGATSQARRSQPHDIVTFDLGSWLERGVFQCRIPKMFANLHDRLSYTAKREFPRLEKVLLARLQLNVGAVAGADTKLLEAHGDRPELLLSRARAVARWSPRRPERAAAAAGAEAPPNGAAAYTEYEVVQIVGEVEGLEWLAEASLWARMGGDSNVQPCVHSPDRCTHGGAFMLSGGGTPLQRLLDPRCPPSDVDVLRIVHCVCTSVLHLWEHNFHVGHGMLVTNNIAMYGDDDATTWLLANGIAHCGERFESYDGRACLPLDGAALMFDDLWKAVGQHAPYVASWCVALHIVRLACCLCTENYGPIAAASMHTRGASEADFDAALADSFAEVPALLARAIQRYSRPGTNTTPSLLTFLRTIDLDTMQRAVDECRESPVATVFGLAVSCSDCLTQMSEAGIGSLLVYRRQEEGRRGGAPEPA